MRRLDDVNWHWGSYVVTRVRAKRVALRGYSKFSYNGQKDAISRLYFVMLCIGSL